ncbi:MAG: hypothetical protein LBH45_07185 [Campylobacteraceae bacterium]|jgi:hypothetical protein|nr:hypothetical protein [Campylobacteraceae bacterium]
MSFDELKKLVECLKTKYYGLNTLSELQLALDCYFYEGELKEKTKKMKKDAITKKSSVLKDKQSTDTCNNKKQQNERTKNEYGADN